MPQTKTLVVPCIHMNGTSEKSLLDAIEEAYMSLGVALDKLRECVPNARDYYVYAGNKFDEAREQHRSRTLAIHNARDELQAIAVAIMEKESECTVELN